MGKEFLTVTTLKSSLAVCPATASTNPGREESGQVLKREQVKLMALVKRWRADATELMRLSKEPGLPDHASPVRIYVQAQLLRDVSRTLKRCIDDLNREHY